MQMRFNRLRCMTPAEVAYRAVRALQARAEKSGIARKAEVPAADLAARGNAWIHANPKVDAATYVEAAERIAHGFLDIFALRGYQLGAPPRWNRDPKSGIEAPLVYGKMLDYRDPDLVGDIKYLWEPNRHLHLVTLAQAWAMSGEDRYFVELTEQLDSWFIACPRGPGPNWARAREAALRRINRSMGWPLIGGVQCVRARLVRPALVGQQPAHRRGRGAVHRREYLAALAARGRLGGHRPAPPRAR